MCGNVDIIFFRCLSQTTRHPPVTSLPAELSLPLHLVFVTATVISSCHHCLYPPVCYISPTVFRIGTTPARGNWIGCVVALHFDLKCIDIYIVYVSCRQCLVLKADMTYLYTHLKVHGAYLWYDSIDVHFLQDFLSELSGKDSRWCSDNTRQSWEKSIGLWELNPESSADVQHQHFLVKQVPLSSTLHARSVVVLFLPNQTASERVAYPTWMDYLHDQQFRPGLR